MNSNTKQRRNSLSAFHGKLKARAEAVKAVVKKPAAETGHPENTNTIEDDALSSEESEQLRAEIRLQHGKVKSLEKSNQILRKQLDELQTLYTESENRCTIMNDENIVYVGCTFRLKRFRNNLHIDFTNFQALEIKFTQE